MKNNIVEQAISLFLQYGYKSVTMDEIAQHMHISKKTIYTYFCNKEALVEESAMAHFNNILEKIKVISKQAKDPIIELYQLKKEALNHMSNEQTSPLYQLQKFYPSIYAEMRAKEFEAMSGLFYTSLSKGVNTGLFRAEINLDFVTRIFFNGIKGVSDIELFPIEKYKVNQLLIDFSEYHLRAICTPLGTEKLEYYKKELNL